MTRTAKRGGTGRGRGRPRGGDSAEVRRRVLAAAIDLIGRQGYGATSMAQVAEAADLSPTGLHHHFPSKGVLLAAVLGYRDEQDTAAYALGESPEPWGYLDNLVTLARANARRRGLVQLFTTVIGEATTPEHPAHGWMCGHYETVLSAIRNGIERDREAGVARADTPAERIARETVALMDGYQTQWLLDPEVDMAALLEEYVAEVKARWSVTA